MNERRASLARSKAGPMISSGFANRFCAVMDAGAFHELLATARDHVRAEGSGCDQH